MIEQFAKLPTDTAMKNVGLPSVVITQSSSQTRYIKRYSHQMILQDRTTAAIQQNSDSTSHVYQMMQPNE